MPARHRLLTSLFVCIALSTAIGSCGNPATGSQSSKSESNMPGFALRSPSFNSDGSIPVKYSCDGENVSPALEWSGAPSNAVSLALIVDDPDANGFVHWVLYNMTGSSSGMLPEAVSASPDAPAQGRNGFGQIGYGGPCPPSGTHRYQFTLYALSGPMELTGAPSAEQVEQAITGVLIEKTTLTAQYTRRR